MHSSVMEFLRKNISREEIFNKDVLEVGSQNINGSPREVIAPLGPRIYWGVDFCVGDGVDLALDVKSLVSHFGKSIFDVVISTEMLEHAEDWKTAITQMKEVLRPGGVLIITARGPGFPYHGFPHDYWRYTVSDFKAMFSDMKIEVCEPDTAPGVLFKATKTERTGSADLSNLSIEPIAVPPEMIQVSGSVDLIITNWNTLPWLKLAISQVRRFNPRIPVKMFVWDNGSTDGSVEWLQKEGIRHFSSPENLGHAEALQQSFSKTDSPYVAFLDVDAIPTQWWWLDEAIGILQDEKVGIVGLGAKISGEHHRRFVHPSFCVFRRDLYKTLELSPLIVHDYYVLKTAFDVCERMSSRVEDAGYILKFVGETNLDLQEIGIWKNRVVHCGSSTPVIVWRRADEPFVKMIDQVILWHRQLLTKLGVWQEFEGYLKEASDRNDLCLRYIEKAVV